MAITMFYYFFVLIIVFLLILNNVYPLLVPKYGLFFMFRKDKLKDAIEPKREEEIRLIKAEIENIIKPQKKKVQRKPWLLKKQKMSVRSRRSKKLKLKEIKMPQSSRHIESVKFLNKKITASFY